MSIKRAIPIGGEYLSEIKVVAASNYSDIPCLRAGMHLSTVQDFGRRGYCMQACDL